MFRIIFSILLPFISPFFILISYRKFKPNSENKKLPFKSLAIIGLIFSILFLFFFSDTKKFPTKSDYILPRFENGKIVPAEMKVNTNAN